MYLKHPRTYLLMAISVLFYATLIYLPTRKPTMDQVLSDMAQQAQQLQVDSSDYGIQLNNLLNDTLKMQQYIHDGLINASTDVTNEQAYMTANSAFHNIELQLLVLLLNHDLYAQQPKDPVSQTLSQNDIQQLGRLIDNVSSQDLSTVQAVDSFAWHLMKDKGAAVGGIYILARDMELIGKSDDMLGNIYFSVDRAMLDQIRSDLSTLPSVPQVGLTRVTSSSIDNCVDIALSALQSINRGNGVHSSSVSQGGLSAFPVALASYHTAEVPLPSGPAYVRLSGPVTFSAFTSGPFDLNVPAGRYNLMIVRDGDFPVDKEIDVADTMPANLPLTRSDRTMLAALRPVILADLHSADLDTITLGIRSGADFEKASDSYLMLEQAFQHVPLTGPTSAQTQYIADQQPESLMPDLKSLNDQLYSVVNGYTDSEDTLRSLLTNIFPLFYVDAIGVNFKAGNQIPITLNYSLANVVGVESDPSMPSVPVAIDVRFAWLDPQGKIGGWDVIFRHEDGRWYVQGIVGRVKPGSTNRSGTVFDYKTNNDQRAIRKLGTDWINSWQTFQSSEQSSDLAPSTP